MHSSYHSVIKRREIGEKNLNYWSKYKLLSKLFNCNKTKKFEVIYLLQFKSETKFIGKII